MTTYIFQIMRATIKILPPHPTICSGKTKKSKYLRSCFCEKDKEAMINFLLKEGQCTHPGETASDNPTESKSCCCCCESSSFLAEDAHWRGSSGQAPPSGHSVILTPYIAPLGHVLMNLPPSLAVGFFNPSSQITKEEGSGTYYWPRDI